MVLAIGARLGPYEIVAPIGAGGMGEVYRAHDPRLGRDVAIKVLPESVASDPARLQRFEHEARAVAALSHPNVLAIFDIGTSAPPFIVTELLEGETLRALLDRGPLPLKRVIDVAVQLVAGLSAAHGRSIVHRDLKPDNVFLTRDGLVKILDFGLAKSTAFAAGAFEATRVATMPGLMLGTVGYMAPEQVRGEPADPRSDVFAFGAILYEMSSGCRAFHGDSPADTISAVLREQPPDLAVTSGVPPALARITRRCLAKHPDDRFQSTLDLRFAIESISGVEPAVARTPKSDEKSIAVLPFTDMSPQKDQAYFCEGMAEEIINALARVDGLHVAPRTSTFQCRERTADLRQLADALGVRTVLEGSVRTAGHRLRVTAQLVDVGDGRTMWADRFDGDMADVFAIQDDISSRIVGGLKGRLFGESIAPVQRHTNNIDAYRLYLKGRHHRYTTYRLLEALSAFELAVEKDPNYAPALAEIAYTTIALAIYGFVAPRDARSKARDAIARALASDDHLPTVHAALGRYYFNFDSNWVESLRSFERALAIAPSEPEVHGVLGINYACRGEAAGAVRHGDHAIAIDPLSAWSYGARGLSEYVLGNIDRAIERGRSAVELRPDSVLGQWVLGAALMIAGRADEGIAALDAAVALIGEADYLLSLLTSAHAAAGNRERAEAIFQKLEQKAAGTWVSAAWRATAACGLREIDRALALVEQACDEGDPAMMLCGGAMFDPLRGHPRFVEVVRRTGLPPSIGLGHTGQAGV